MLQHDFEASSLGACTVICWRPHTACLPPMIALGTQHGAKVYTCYYVCADDMPYQTRLSLVQALAGPLNNSLSDDRSTAMTASIEAGKWRRNLLRPP